MDPNYAMAKFGLESKDSLKSKHRGCWYYTKYFFFFLSIIQFLIILGLVLFMLYGNAHVSTELRLIRVENRFANLTQDYNWLNGNFTLLKGKLANVEKENVNCTNILTAALKQLQNRTSIVRPGPVSLLPVSDACKGYQSALDRCNATYKIDTLQLRYESFILQRDHDRLKENCEQRNSTLTVKLLEALSEKERLHDEKKDLQTQTKVLQAVCTSINQKFDNELERMRNRISSLISSNEPIQYSKCWHIDSEIKNNIDITLNRMKQDVGNVMLENSQLKTEKDRLSDNIQKCSQEKLVAIAENTNLSKEKGELGKQLSDKKEELSATYLRYRKKEEELETCRRVQTPVRVPNLSFPRN
ncbi:plasmalemma vesicle-associated protein [Anomaloglossus baeobatrachus]|uniref:plasmalemma vesicle-associated protein n=1 Tax=Anomaloglossus baeobatrachus TaxID=238106 RepID=UPI003F501F7A